MKYIQEAAKNIEIIDECDVLVVGGGPSGLAASITASRAGADTILVERYGCFGGAISHVGVEAVAWYRHEHTIEAGGLLAEIEAIAADMGASSPECQSDSQALDVEMFKYIADKLVLGANVRPILHCMAVEVIVEDGVIKGIITESKSGRKVILAKRIIDCSGDADIAALAGAPFSKSERQDLMAATPVFNVCNVDSERFLNYIYNDLKPTYLDWGGSWAQKTDKNTVNMFSPYIEWCFNKAYEDGLIKKVKHVNFGGTYSTVSEDGCVTQLNLIFLTNIDCTDVRDLTHAEIIGREAVMDAIKALKAYIPGFENARLRNFGMTLGTRESRIIDGHYSLTEEDVCNEARFSDSIGIYPEFVDGLSILKIPTTGRYFHVPYRSILPKGIRNLLVAGRTISGDKVAHCAFRNMSCCIVTGQGAGAAAAVSINENVDVSDVNILMVQKELERQKVRVF